jgi:hypothetical protein
VFWRTSYGRQFEVWIDNLNGICFTDSDCLIWINGDLRNKELMSTGIHEWLHSELTWSENKVSKYEAKLADRLWPIYDIRVPSLADVALAIYGEMPSHIRNEMKERLTLGLFMFLSNMRDPESVEFTHVSAIGKIFSVRIIQIKSLCKYESNTMWINDRAAGKNRLSLFLREWIRAEMAGWPVEDASGTAHVLCAILWCYCKNRKAKYLEVEESINRAFHWLSKGIRMELIHGLNEFLKKVGYA